MKSKKSRRSTQMSKCIKMSTSEKGKAIWEGVSRAARYSPTWIRPQIEKAAEESAKRIIESAKKEEENLT
jgi:hypothetical protein